MIPVRLAWCRDTSADPDGWSSARPSHGQCAVTALIVQDLLGGELIRAINEGVSHYWNQLPDGTHVDLTRDQFDRWRPSQVEHRTRDYVLADVDTERRYRRLHDIVAAS